MTPTRALLLRGNCGHPIALGQTRDQLHPLLIAYRDHHPAHPLPRIETLTGDQLTEAIAALTRGDHCPTCDPPLPEGPTNA